MDFKTIREVLESYGKRALSRMKAKLKGTKLQDKIYVEIVEKPDSVTLQINMPAYGQHVDAGIYPYGDKRPFKDLPKRSWAGGAGQFRVGIKKWANSKRIRFNTVTDYSKYPELKFSSKGFIKNESRDFLIRRSIVLRGVKPRPFLDELYFDIDGLQRDLGSAAAHDIAVGLQTAFDDAGMGDN